MTATPCHRRRLLLSGLAALAGSVAGNAAADPAGLEQALGQDGTLLLLRHAMAPGGGDPATFRLGDCSTQRNLSAAGQAQARRFGARWRAKAWPLGALWASPWCRTLDTAQLAFPGTAVQEAPAFASFFQTPSLEAPQTQAARSALLAWRGPGVLVVVTHQVNITALTGVVPAQGEGVVLRAEGAALRLIGTLPAPL